jgi:hypothetical protein
MAGRSGRQETQREQRDAVEDKGKSDVGTVFARLGMGVIGRSA